MLTRSGRILLLLIILVLGTAFFSAVSLVAAVPPARSLPETAAVNWEGKVDPWVLNSGSAGETEFILVLQEQADLSATTTLATKLEKGTYVYETLTAVAKRTQGPVLAALEASGAEHRAFWVANMIWVRGDLGTVRAMARRSDVSHVYANPAVRLAEPHREPTPARREPDGVEWNINHVSAPDVWAAGFTGQNVVIGGQDTGYDWDHPALINQYRGWAGGIVNHDYSWHDAIHTGGGACGPDSPEPCDDHGHGTHTMGTMVGNDLDPDDPGWPASAPNAVGMAPGADWIGCRNMDQGVGTPASYTECYEFFVAPYPVGGNPMTDGDPAKAPDVINNSWACPASEGCTTPDMLLAVVQNVRAAGIVTVHSAGNSGPACGSVSTPSAIYAESFTVGATDSGDNIAPFSSRGAVTVDGSNRLKPDISAPGVNIRSTVRGGGYQGGWSGTSMAGPHVAGLAALLVSAEHALAGQVDQLEDLIKRTVVPRTATQTCDGLPGDQIPNNTYGWGRIDALAAFQEVAGSRLAISKHAPATVLSGGLLTYTLTLSHSNVVSETRNVILTDTLPANTVFYTATAPHTFDGAVLRWEFPSMAAGERRDLQFAVRVPISITGQVVNDRYGVSGDGVQPVAGVPVSTTILTPGVSLIPDHYGFGAAGSVLAYTHVLTNTSGVPDTFDLSLASTRGWTTIGDTAKALDAGMGTTIMLSVTVPVTATPGTLETAVLTATSENSPAVWATVTDTTVVAYQIFWPLFGK